MYLSTLSNSVILDTSSFQS